MFSPKASHGFPLASVASGFCAVSSGIKSQPFRVEGTAQRHSQWVKDAVQASFVFPPRFSYPPLSGSYVIPGQSLMGETADAN